ncbi:MAG: tRNA (adenosine(37)-N6)-threonylcarbamoyltransferase complex dimerization subunit type 1 TsaB [Verrucomicrobiae bacterium]|nr:tRNA (adenosine(37)-N6)-threonylcarbamoyltransferase complex dimerization subunit type 1 TsaB [Verrucomicrobiae bacterium]
MITLALDTSTATGSVALLDADRLVWQTTFARDGLFPALESMPLKAFQIERFVVGLGPGSFTGIRAGVAAVKGLALPAARPILGVASYDAIAWSLRNQFPPDCERLCVLGDARRDEVYFALYDRTAHRQGPIRVGPLEKIADEIHHPLWFASAEIETFAPLLRESFGGFANIHPAPVVPSAVALAQLARQGCVTGSLEPLYLR